MSVVHWRRRRASCLAVHSPRNTLLWGSNDPSHPFENTPADGKQPLSTRNNGLVCQQAGKEAPLSTRDLCRRPISPPESSPLHRVHPIATPATGKLHTPSNSRVLYLAQGCSGQPPLSGFPIPSSLAGRGHNPPGKANFLLAGNSAAISAFGPWVIGNPHTVGLPQPQSGGSSSL